jgi:geranylgeranyl pyrophosphate synthase
MMSSHDLIQGAGALIAQNGKKMGHQVAVVEAPAEDPMQAMMARLRESGAVEVARMQAYEMARRARKALEQVPTSPARDELASLIDLVVDRDQ